MVSAVEHIAQIYKNPVYSEIFYLESNPVTGILEKNFAKEGARAIYSHWIYFRPFTVDQPGQAGLVFTLAPIEFRDQFNQLLFRTVSPGTGWAPLFRVLSGQQLKIVSVPETAFQVSFQYIL